MRANIRSISYVLPEKVLTNEMLSLEHPEWPIEKIFTKTGIKSRRISAVDEYSLELAIQAGKKFFKEHAVERKDIEFIIFCSVTPKHLMPINACMIQDALGLPITAGALDVSMGCSGYLYSLLMAESLIVSGRVKNVLLITADTLSKLINPEDRCLKTIFGDGASASLISVEERGSKGMQLFDFGTDGSGHHRISARGVGLAGLASGQPYQPDLFMDGSGIFHFALEYIPKLIDRLLQKSKMTLEEIDFFIFHQANGYLLNHLREKLRIREDKFFIFLEDIGNTGSSSIPIAFATAIKQRKIKPGQKIMLVAFGIGLSWASTILEY